MLLYLNFTNYTNCKINVCDLNECFKIPVRQRLKFFTFGLLIKNVTYPYFTLFSYEFYRIKFLNKKKFYFFCCHFIHV